MDRSFCDDGLYTAAFTEVGEISRRLSTGFDEPKKTSKIRHVIAK
ncbi:unnamed protein product [Nippostrongylus brasiliensis]|uniref:Transcriptional regulator n=1 Tax=Nippostrongylus brasiliensis TaxID=27835 RepID=A0A0N4XQ22_NIPBR|nr:unnamed protein product [Nippostrongylus brasiliensis]